MMKARRTEKDGADVRACMGRRARGPGACAQGREIRAGASRGRAQAWAGERTMDPAATGPPVPAGVAELNLA